MSSEKEREVRARWRVNVHGAGPFVDLVGAIERAHDLVARDLESLGLRPVGRPVIEEATQNEMTLSWRVEQITPPGDKPIQSGERAW